MADVEITNEVTTTIDIYGAVCECGERLDVQAVAADSDYNLLVTVSRHRCARDEAKP